MIREGEPNVTLKYLSSNPQRKLAINNFTEGASISFRGGEALGERGALAYGTVVTSLAGWSKTIRPVPSKPIAIQTSGSGTCTDGLDLVQTQGRNIRAYAEYLVQRTNSYASTKVDYVRAGEGRLARLTVDKGLLRETESVQDQIRALLRCDVCVKLQGFVIAGTVQLTCDLVSDFRARK